MPAPLRILFLCTGNSCRSQMAEGWARHLKPGIVEPFSAGTMRTALDPLAIAAMAEAGVDISGQKSKSLADLPTRDFDWVVTVCAAADAACPVFAGRARVVHAGFEDPPSMVAGMTNRDEALAVYRRVRDEIRAFVEGIPRNLEALPSR